MVSDLQTTIAQCDSCKRNGSWHLYKRCRQVFLASGSLDFAARDMLGTLSRVQKRNQNIIEVTDCYFKFTRAVPSSKMSSTHLANIFLDQWIIPFSILFYLLANHGTQFVNNLLANVCGYPGGKQITTPA